MTQNSSTDEFFDDSNQIRAQLNVAEIRNDYRSKASISSNHNNSNFEIRLSSPNLSKIRENVELGDDIQNSQRGSTQLDIGIIAESKAP